MIKEIIYVSFILYNIPTCGGGGICNRSTGVARSYTYILMGRHRRRRRRDYILPMCSDGQSTVVARDLQDEM